MSNANNESGWEPIIPNGPTPKTKTGIMLVPVSYPDSVVPRWDANPVVGIGETISIIAVPVKVAQMPRLQNQSPYEITYSSGA
jgi:hypothetical protein